MEEVKETQRPYMDGSGCGDVVLVSVPLSFEAGRMREEADQYGGCAWSDIAVLLQKMASTSCRPSIAVDDASRNARGLEVRAFGLLHRAE